ncbi:MAG: hypothetical protein JJ900_11745 [Rhodospirillales bacterium]|nr:hypothetical protein [Rhodospirillales bacterium]MBO6787514.1 hypothetical protein [Rhodospirillales bacterium]
MSSEAVANDPRPDAAELALIAARCFQGGDGRQMLAYLRSITMERTLGPGACDAQLRHLEGQRQLVHHILTLTERGRNGPTSMAVSTSDVDQ